METRQIQSLEGHSLDKLPPINRIGLTAPFGWLAGALVDLGKAPAACLVYGLVIALLSMGLLGALYTSGGALWALALTQGFVFLAPMLAMGMYEAGRQIGNGQRPRLSSLLVVRTAIRQDTVYLGFALLMIFMFWGQIAQIVYGLSTWQLHQSLEDFLRFALHSVEGHRMLIGGSLVGGVLALITYCLVVVTAPMLLDREANIFIATVTSFRAVMANPAPMLFWALMIVALLIVAAATGFAALVVIFPWLGLASWRARQALVG